MIIKAYETISEQMQVAKLDTSVYYLSTNEGAVTPEGSYLTEYLFTIKENEGQTTEKTWALIMQISRYCDQTFVDQILWAPLECADAIAGTANTVNTNFDTTVTTGVVWDWNAGTGNSEATYFCTATNYKSCNILKESFTYFYEIAGNIFEQA